MGSVRSEEARGGRASGAKTPGARSAPIAPTQEGHSAWCHRTDLIDEARSSRVLAQKLTACRVRKAAVLHRVSLFRVERRWRVLLALELRQLLLQQAYAPKRVSPLSRPAPACERARQFRPKMRHPRRC